jgi:hypothetical protein
MAKYLHRTTSGAADSGRAQRSSVCDAQREAPRATAWAPRTSTCAPPGDRFGNKIKYLRGAAGIGLGTTIRYLRHTTSAAANKNLGTLIKIIVNRIAGAGNNWAKAYIHKSWARIQMNPPVL